MAVQLMPPVKLEPRDSDISVSNELLLKLSLFSQLLKKPGLDKYPGAIVLRHYREKEEVFRQGEPGSTAFYILTSEDMLKVRQAQLELAKRENEKSALQKHIERLQARITHLKTAPPEDEERKVASVHIAIPRNSKANRGTLTRRLLNFKSRLVQGPTTNDQGNTLYIPQGGPATQSYDTLKAPLEEGEIFGEMSCLYRVPRSATVRAERECYALELNRNIYDSIQRDKAYKAQSDEVYRRRVLDLQIRKFSLFAELTDEQFNAIRHRLELLYYEPGQIICDEHERADALYIIRLGLVKVMKNVSWLVGLEDVINWPAFSQALLDGVGMPASTPQRTFWSMLPDDTRIRFRTTEDFEKIAPPDQLELLYGINEVISSEKMTDAKPMQELVKSNEAIQAQLVDFPKNRKQWTPRHIRQHNRILLEAMIPKGLRKHRHYATLESILAYQSAGDFFGEMALMLNRPRGATCLAYGHPNDIGQVELVKVPVEVLNEMMNCSPVIHEHIKGEISKRRREAILRLAAPVWDDKDQVQFSQQFEELGLIQGQQLMLIDLDRCTRCDECVQACINTHDDQHTRLFLDGPRFGNYLVPTSCRSCLDPVCLIGCPVGSIRRGANRQIIIEDWCIGCTTCAEKCPYGSIQMHDLGVVPEVQRGWKYMPSSLLGDAKWQTPRFNDRKWLTGSGPFKWNRDMRESVKDLPAEEPRLCFRFQFEMTKKQLKEKGIRFRIQIISRGDDVKTWLNGRELNLDNKPRQGRHEYTVPTVKEGEGEEKAILLPIKDFLWKGMNTLAVEVTPTSKPNEDLLRFRLDEIRRPKDLPDDVDQNVAEEVTEKLVTLKAVVCDLCSTSHSQIPACVHACPHEAAMRVDARSEFPMK